MSNTTLLILVCVSVVFGVCRALGFKSKSFQAFAHLWVGGLIGAFAATYNIGREWAYVEIAGLLTALEVICFLVLR